MFKSKNNHYKLVFTILILSSIGLSSCLKTTLHPPLYGWNTPDVISFQDNGGVDGSGAGFGSTTTPYPSYNFSFKLQNDTAGFDAIIVYGPKGPAPEDITVNLAIDTVALNAFNTANSTSYVCPDNSIYTLPASVIIKKGETQAYAHVVIKGSASYDFNASYALPITITSASSGTVSPNMGTEINTFVVSNQYAGNYSAAGYFYHPSAARAIDLTAGVLTVNANTVAIPLGDLGSSGYYANVTVDPATNALTITSGLSGVDMFPLAALPTSNPGYTSQWAKSSLCNNTYDPATKTFYLRIGYIGGTGWRVAEEILTAQ